MAGSSIIRTDENPPLGMGERERTHEREGAGNMASTADTSDAERFAALVPPLAPAVLRVAAALVGPADAEDAAQEAITRAWLAWASLRDRSAVRPWLLRITVNVCRQWYRGRYGTRLRMTEPFPEDEASTFALLGADPGASDATAALDLRQAVNALPDDLRIIVMLRYFGGMDATEVGAALGMPPATVRTRLRRALMLLRDRLKHSGELAAPAPAPRDEQGGSHV